LKFLVFGNNSEYPNKAFSTPDETPNAGMRRANTITNVPL